MRHPHPAPKTAAVARPNAQMSMSSNARASMRVTEKAIYKYYNDMGKNKGNCTWGAGILAHRGVCSEEELMRTVSAQSVDIVFGQKVAEAEGIVRRGVHVRTESGAVRCALQPDIQCGPKACRGHIPPHQQE